MNGAFRTAVAVILMGGSAAVRPSVFALLCNSASHGVVRGGPWARVGGPFHHERDCDRAMPRHRGAEHGGDIAVVLRCTREG